MSGVGKNIASGQSWTYSGPSVTSYCGKQYGGVAFKPWTGSASEANAKSSALANVGASPISAMEDILQIRSTLGAFPDLFKTLLSRADPIKKSANAFLGVEFGLLPTFRNVIEGVDLIDKGLKRLRKNVRLRASGSDSAFEIITDYQKPGYVGYDVKQERRHEFHATVYYVLSEDLSGIPWNFGLSLDRLPTGLWNVIPYSFLVDRIYNVSDMIDGFLNTTSPRIRYEGGVITEYSREYYSCKAVSFSSGSPNWTESVSGDLCEQNNRFVIRHPWTPTIADIFPEVDYLGLIDDCKKVAELSAMFLQKIRR